MLIYSSLAWLIRVSCRREAARRDKLCKMLLGRWRRPICSRRWRENEFLFTKFLVQKTTRDKDFVRATVARAISTDRHSLWRCWPNVAWALGPASPRPDHVAINGRTCRRSRSVPLLLLLLQRRRRNHTENRNHRAKPTLPCSRVCHQVANCSCFRLAMVEKRRERSRSVGIVVGLYSKKRHGS